MVDFLKVAKKEEIPPGSAKTVQVGDVPVALYNLSGTFYATHNTCLHRQGPLGEGTLDDKIVTCPWHGWRYDVTSGQCQNNPQARVQTFEVKVEGDDVLVRV